MSKVVIDERGRIEIPEELREQFSLRSGMELEIAAEGRTIRIEPDQDAKGKIVWKDGVPVFRADEPEVITVDMVNKAIDEARLERERWALGLEP